MLRASSEIVQNLTQRNYIESLKCENAALKSSNIKFDADVKFYESQLATTKVEYALSLV